MDNSLSKKLRYHKGMKQTSTDKSSSQILTSSPLLDRKRDLYKNLHDNEKFALDECRNTIQSGAEEGNFLIESQDAEVFRTALKNSRGKSDILGDDEHTTKYAKSTERLLETIGESLEYFHKLGDWNLKSEKVSTVKILKEDYEKFQMEYNKIVSENIKLKEKIKSLKESGIPKGGVTNNGLVFSENFNVNKMLDSLLFLQTKNQELEKENKILLVEMEEMKKKLDTSKKKGQGERRNLTKKSPVHSTNNYTSNNKTKNDHMEYLLKEQISCMQKMLMLIQDDKEVNTMPSVSIFHLTNRRRSSPYPMTMKGNQMTPIFILKRLLM